MRTTRRSRGGYIDIPSMNVGLVDPLGRLAAREACVFPGVG